MSDDSALFAPPERNFSPWYAWMRRLLDTTVVDPLPVDDLAHLDEWRERCRKRLLHLLGRWPDPVPLNVEITEETGCSGYTRQRVVFDTEAFMSVPAYLLIPDQRSSPGPAVLAVHGHGPGKAQVCGLEHTDMPNADYAHQLAKRGFVVLAPDLRCFGERLDWNPPDHYACDINLVHAVMDGWSPLTMNLWDLGRCLDVLSEHPLVDPNRLGMVGVSYGGTVTLFLAALDERVAAAVVSGFFSSWASSHRVPWNMCGSQILPGMLGQIEHVDLGALVAPRPLLIESGRQDMLFPIEAATKSGQQLARVYELLGVPEALVHDAFDGDHQWHGEVAYPLLERWLGSGDVGER